MTNKTNREKFLKLLLPVYKSLERYAISLTMNRETAKDLTNDTILAALENLDTLKSDSAFLSFLFTIARRQKVNYFRKNRLITPSDPGTFERLKTNSLSPEDYTDIQILKKALIELPEKYSEALTLFEFSGLSYKEIALVQKVSQTNVKQRIYRARKALAKKLNVKDIKEDSKVKNLDHERIVK